MRTPRFSKKISVMRGAALTYSGRPGFPLVVTQPAARSVATWRFLCISTMRCRKKIDWALATLCARSSIYPQAGKAQLSDVQQCIKLFCGQCNNIDLIVLQNFVDSGFIAACRSFNNRKRQQFPASTSWRITGISVYEVLWYILYTLFLSHVVF